ncbi:methyltransferase domain-containing protein [Ditylenchus destructor]|nr:methyltransferase domain-containing protein [Ditylenchus destructor]
MALCNFVTFYIYFYLDETEYELIDDDFFQQFPRNEMICLKGEIIGDTDDEPGYFMCDPENYAALYPTLCTVHSVGVRQDFDFERELVATMKKTNCNVNLYDKKKIEIPQNETSFNVVNVSRLIIGLVSTHYSVALKDHFHRNNFAYKFPLLKVDIGRDGLELVSTQEFGLQPCQLLLTVEATLQEINEFVLRMKLRAYLLFGIRIWKSADERDREKQYNLSFIKSYCIWESTTDYVFSKMWEKNK